MKENEKKAPKGSALIIILGGLAAILSSSTAGVKNPAIKSAMLSVTVILILVCLGVIYRQKKQKKGE